MLIDTEINMLVVLSDTERLSANIHRMHLKFGWDKLF